MMLLIGIIPIALLSFLLSIILNISIVDASICVVSVGAVLSLLGLLIAGNDMH